jgi:5-methylcytosine-specific restriction protein B
VSGDPFRVPENVFVIATMNTADRSIALLDAALRRRFGFIELMPDSKVLGRTNVAGLPLGRWLEALNSRIREHAGRDARNLQIGHSYLLQNGRPIDSVARLAQVVRNEIIPLIQEYTYEDFGALEKIMGSGLVDIEHLRIHEDLFDGAHEDDFIKRLLDFDPEMATSSEAVEAEATPSDDVDEEEEPILASDADSDQANAAVE